MVETVMKASLPSPCAENTPLTKMSERLGELVRFVSMIEKAPLLIDYEMDRLVEQRLKGTMAEHEFEYKADGKKYSCSFIVTGVEHSMVEVTTPWGSKPTQLGGTPAIVLARVMAGELYAKHKQMN